jgi:hypothetical protein
LAAVPSAPAALASLSTNTVLESAAVLNQKLKTPPAAPSRSPSSGVPSVSMMVLATALVGVKLARSS